MILKCMQRVLSGENLSFQQALDLVENGDPVELYRAADTIRKKLHGDSLDLCSIVNAKSGKCSEDCKFCAQSSHYDVEVSTYDLVDGAKALSLAKHNERHGVKRFSLVTAGKSVSVDQLEDFNRIYTKLREGTNLSFCASMGFLTPEKALMLKSMGVQRYHCNLETCKSYFPKVCTTHTWEQKVATIKIARDAGMEVCSGGIIGMGETVEQRLELAFELKELGILSIPINILNPIRNTPFAELSPIGAGEILTCIALFRFINPKAIIRLAGGRNLLGDEQEKCFTSGANGSIVGDYLTTIGNSLAEDIKMFSHLGFDVNTDSN